MTSTIDVKEARGALTELPQETWYGEPPSHLKAMDSDNMLVTGMRGAGKTFWWSALQNRDVRQLVGQPGKTVHVD